MLNNLGTINQRERIIAQSVKKPGGNLLLDLHIMPRPGEIIFHGRGWLVAGLVTLLIMIVLGYFCL